MQKKEEHPSVTWAKEILCNTRAVVLDTETTGISHSSEIIAVAIVEITTGKTHETLISCEAKTIPSEATAIHGITKEMLKDARSFPAVWRSMGPWLAAREIVAYNADFDVRLLRQTAQRHNLACPALTAHCVMQRYAAFIGEESWRGDGYRWWKLAEACQHFKIVYPVKHQALADVQATLAVLRHLAAFSC